MSEFSYQSLWFKPLRTGKILIYMLCWAQEDNHAISCGKKVFRKYLEAGVREYWVVNPEEKTVQVHILDNGQYVTMIK